MKRLVLLVLLVAALGACSEDEIKGADKATKSEDIPGNIYQVDVNGMPCVIWMKHTEGDHWAYSGIDCDWRER